MSLQLHQFESRSGIPLSGFCAKSGGGIPRPVRHRQAQIVRCEVIAWSTDLDSIPNVAIQRDPIQAKHVHATDLNERYKAAIEIAKELFSSDVRIEAYDNPDDPEVQHYVVLNVRAAGNPDDLVILQCQWHERVDQLSDEAAKDLRLCIYPS